MYKITTPKRLLQNVVVEYEKFEDIKLVILSLPPLFFLNCTLIGGACLLPERRENSGDVSYCPRFEECYLETSRKCLRLHPRGLKNWPTLLSGKDGYLQIPLVLTSSNINFGERPFFHDQFPPRLLRCLGSHKTLPRPPDSRKNLHLGKRLPPASPRSYPRGKSAQTLWRTM